MSQSVRQELAGLLREHSCTVPELSKVLGLREKEVADHLAHVRRSLRHEARWREEPPQCRECGFVFRKRERPTTPSRCPRCRSERIEPAVFRIEEQG